MNSQVAVGSSQSGPSAPTPPWSKQAVMQSSQGKSDSTEERIERCAAVMAQPLSAAAVVEP